jgi:hypothetical protein
VRLIIEIAGFDCHPNRDIDRVGKFCDADGDLFLIWPVIPAVAILSQLGLSTVKDDAGPIHVDVGMLKVIPRKKDILDVGDDHIPIGAKGFKDTVEGSFAEGRQIEFGTNFRAGDPVVGSLDAEVIRQFVADKGAKQTIDVDTARLVFPENVVEIQDVIQPCNEKNGTNRKGYIFCRLNVIGS